MNPDSNEEMILGMLADGGEEFTSGEALSLKLGLSGSEVWKHVESLRRKGYEIEAISAKGYRLVRFPDRLSALEIGPLLQTAEIGRVIHYRQVLDSTNELAFQLASEGAFHGEVVIAEHQRKGKGRRGRKWVSPAGKNLYCSVILRPQLSPQRCPELTLLAAVAVAETLSQAEVNVSLKWPNDVYVNGRKIAGILTELCADSDRANFVVLGIGVNLNSTGEDFPPEVAALATSVLEARERPVRRALFAAALFSALEAWLQVHASQGFAPVKDAWKRLAVTLGREVRVKGDRHELVGVAEDIDDSGALLVRTAPGKLERVLAGDVELN